MNNDIRTGLLEAISMPALVDMQKTGREPGFYAFDPLGLSRDPKKAATLKTKEIKNGRLAMLAFSGMVTQSVLTGHGFPCKLI
jgi:light-harvesting complex I chlorophyll a/b binding protein 1